MATTPVQITVDVPTPWWDYLVEQYGSETAARQQLLKSGGVTSQWRQILLSYHQTRTGEVARLTAIETAEDSEILRLANKPDASSPGPPS